MSSSAQVRSTEAIEALLASLARFEQRVQNALDSLDGQLRRAAEWIEHDRPSHWKDQIHKAEEAVTQAKVELERCLMFTLDGERPQCREQKAAQQKARARLAYCREKGEAVIRWQREFRHESFEYHGRVGQLRRALEQDLPRARAVLNNILRRLEEYQVERPAAGWGPSATEATAPAPSVARTVEEVPAAPRPSSNAESTQES